MLTNRSLDFFTLEGNMSNDFHIDFFSDSQYEMMTAEISFKGQILCQINKDKGDENLEIEFFHESRILQEEVKMKFDLVEFEKMLVVARCELKQFRK